MNKLSDNNIEDLVENSLINSLSSMYNINQNNSIITKRIFLLRYLIKNYNYYIQKINFDKLHTHTDKIGRFLLEELNIPIFRDYFLFNDIKVYIDLYRTSSMNNLNNIIDTWIYELVEKLYKNDKTFQLISGKDIILNDFTISYLKAKKNIDCKKKDVNYDYLIKYHMVKQLESEYKYSLQPIGNINNIGYGDIHELIYLTFDEKNQRYVTDYFINNRKLKEKELENYLKCHLDKVEDGLTLIETQHKISNGIIDIFARDKNNNYVIIELKVSNKPKDLLWQVEYYYNELNKIYSNKLRFITITPQLPQNFYEILKNKNIEICYYSYKNKEYKFDFINKN